MYAVSHVFGEIIGAWGGRGEPARPGIDVPTADNLARYAFDRCAEVVQSAIAALIESIRDQRGPGRIWFRVKPSYLNRGSEVGDDGVSTRIEGHEEDDELGMPRFIQTGDGTRRVVIGAYYFHAPTPLGSAYQIFDRDYTNRQPELGDHVRWWPQVTQFGTPSDRAQWVDGVVTGEMDGRWCINVYARSGPEAPWHDDATGYTWFGSLVRCKALQSAASADNVIRQAQIDAGLREGHCTPLKGPRCDRCGKPTGPGLDAWAARHATCSPQILATPKPIDPLDVEYDGVKLRHLLSDDEVYRRDHIPLPYRVVRTATQRAAVSAHWSAQLRAKIAASAAAEVQRERGRISCDPRETIDLED